MLWHALASLQIGLLGLDVMVPLAGSAELTILANALVTTGVTSCALNSCGPIIADVIKLFEFTVRAMK